MTTVLVLAALALALSGPVPALLARAAVVRRAPRAATTLWQAVAVAAVLSALGASTALTTTAVFGPGVGWGEWAVAAVALLVTVTVAGRLLLTAHVVGRGLRHRRARHRDLLDLLAARESGVLVLEEDRPVAYCLPGLTGRRVVISRGAAAALRPDELAAVLAHERAHLAARHDLVLEAFTVLHSAFPRWVSSARALAEVGLLVELLADAAARRRHGPLPLARALVTLAQSPSPAVALAAAGSPGQLRARIELLGDDSSHRVLATTLYLAAGAVLGLPTVFVAAPWIAGLPW